ncbi:hypothetical protein K438DRAFT_1777190 [Mycena galopus ATCC 62051]|nr:hypothetical protein K438DRAFT_1777190 [Mycena galopus ATCC 62051]
MSSRLKWLVLCYNRLSIRSYHSETDMRKEAPWTFDLAELAPSLLFGHMGPAIVDNWDELYEREAILGTTPTMRARYQKLSQVVHLSETQRLMFKPAVDLTVDEITLLKTCTNGDQINPVVRYFMQKVIALCQWDPTLPASAQLKIKSSWDSLGTWRKGIHKLSKVEMKRELAFRSHVLESLKASRPGKSNIKETETQSARAKLLKAAAKAAKAKAKAIKLGKIGDHTGKGKATKLQVEMKRGISTPEDIVRHQKVHAPISHVETRDATWKNGAPMSNWYRTFEA